MRFLLIFMDICSVSVAFPGAIVFIINQKGSMCLYLYSSFEGAFNP